MLKSTYLSITLAVPAASTDGRLNVALHLGDEPVRTNSLQAEVRKHVKAVRAGQYA